MKFTQLSEAKFEKFSRSCACQNFLQSVEMYRRYQKKGVEAYLTGVEDKDKIIAAGLVLSNRSKFGQKIFKVPGGFLLDYDAKNAPKILEFYSKELKQFLLEKQGMILQISPNIVSQPRDNENNIVAGKDHLKIKEFLQKIGYKYLGEYENSKWIYVLETKGQDKDELFRNFRTSHRQSICKAKKENVKIRELGVNELSVLKDITSESGKRHGFQDPDIAYYKEMKEVFGDKIKFLVSEVEIDGKIVPLTASMFVYHGNEIVYLFSGSVRKYQKYCGSHLMQWHMIQEAVDKGMERYNFYGVHPIEGNGVYLFKQGYRGHVEELLGTFILPLNLKGKIYALAQKEQEYSAVH